MKKKCVKCGKIFKEGGFCPYCGEGLIDYIPPQEGTSDYCEPVEDIQTINQNNNQDYLAKFKSFVMKNKSSKKALTITGCIVASLIIVVFLCNFIYHSNQYNNGEKALDNDDYKVAISCFDKAFGYKDAMNKLQNIYRLYQVISAGDNNTVGLKSNGTVVAVGNNDYGQCNVGSWSDIIAVSAGCVGYNTVGLKSDGTVVAVGNNDYGQCNVGNWKGIISISAGGSHTVGLKANGTVVTTGDNSYGQCNVGSWKDIVAVSAGDNDTVGLKANGTVVTAGDNSSGQCNVAGWKDIIAISVGYNDTIGLKADGTVIAVGNNSRGQCNVGSWNHVVAISAGGYHTVGLNVDGTVVATGLNGVPRLGIIATIGSNSSGQCDVGSWNDIVAVSAGTFHTVGLKADGTVVAVGDNDDGPRCDVNSWTDIYVGVANSTNETTSINNETNNISSSTINSGSDISSNSQTSSQYVTGVTLNKSSISIAVGQSETLTATITPANATDKTVLWSSDNSSVAAVGNTGKVTTEGTGTATITVTTTDGEFSATCTVTVTHNAENKTPDDYAVTVTQPVTSVTLDKSSSTIIVGGTDTLTATIAPYGATDSTVKWNSSNKNVATVDDNGNVNAVAAGTAKITVTTNDGRFIATCVVTVDTQPVTGIIINGNYAGGGFEVKVGQTYDLTTTIIPFNATNQAVTWSSNDPTVGTVDDNGKVTAVGVGTAFITAKTVDGGFTAIWCMYVND